MSPFLLQVPNQSGRGENNHIMLEGIRYVILNLFSFLLLLEHFWFGT